MGSVSGDSGHGSSHIDAYDELFHTNSIVDLDPLDNDKEETGNKVSVCLLVHNEDTISINKSRWIHLGFTCILGRTKT